MKTAYIHGRIYGKRTDAFLVEDGRFKSFASTASILSKLTRSDEAIIDLNDHLVFPGFHDSHMHVLGLGQSLRVPDVSSATSIDELVALLKKHLKAPALYARGFHEAQLREKRMVTCADLNRVSARIPVYLERICGHLSVGNDAAIAAAHRLEKAPSNDKNFDNDRGHFIEKDAIRWLYRPHATHDADVMAQDILTAQAHLFKHGVTAAGSDDFSASDEPFDVVFDVLDTLDRRGQLKLRIYEQANVPAEKDVHRYVQKNLHRHRGQRFRSGALKLLTDGSLGARSAYMKEPYADMDTRGVRVFEPAPLATLIKTAHAHGMDIALHAIGDQAVEDILDIIETIPANERLARRHAIIHAQCASREQIARMKALHVGAQIQPIFINSDREIVSARLGERQNDSYLFNTMVQSGLPTALSTDAPVEAINPFENVYVSMTRTSLKRPDLGSYLPEEALSFNDAIDAYTRSGAYFSYQDHELGRLSAGFHADFIVVDGLSPERPETLLRAKVRQTYVAGECVHDASEHSKPA